jgi:predicted RNA-binding protein with PIN domain
MPYWFDGNNLIGQSVAAARTNAGVRKDFLSTLSSLNRSGGGRFLVYFDGDDVDRAAHPPGISVRYSAPLSTDDAILRRLREVHRAEEVIIVTNDRGLIVQCRHEGAKALTWQEFIAKMQSRSARAPAPRRKEDPVDVDEWIEFFGFDRTKVR